MKKLILFVLVILGTGISSFAQQLPNSLPIGSTQKVWDQTLSQLSVISMTLFGVDGNPMEGTLEFPGSDNFEIPEGISSASLATLIQMNANGIIFNNIGLNNEGEIFSMYVDAGTKRGHVDGALLWNKNTFTVERDSVTGGMVAPLISLGDRFKSYYPIEVSNIFWVEVILYNATNGVVYRDLTQNGAPESCSLSKNFGNGVLYFPAVLFTGTYLREQKLHGTVTLFINDERTAGAEYDFLSGYKTRTLVPPPKITLTPSAEGMLVSFPNPGGNKSVTIEVSKDFVTWTKLTTVKGTGPTLSFLDATAITNSMCFYRTKVP